MRGGESMESERSGSRFARPERRISRHWHRLLLKHVVKLGQQKQGEAAAAGAALAAAPPGGLPQSPSALQPQTPLLHWVPSAALAADWPRRTRPSSGRRCRSTRRCRRWSTCRRSRPCPPGSPTGRCTRRRQWEPTEGPSAAGIERGLGRGVEAAVARHTAGADALNPALARRPSPELLPDELPEPLPPLLVAPSPAAAASGREAAPSPVTSRPHAGRTRSTPATTARIPTHRLQR